MPRLHAAGRAVAVSLNSLNPTTAMNEKNSCKHPLHESEPLLMTMAAGKCH
jgi:hypothetical protein